MAARATWRCAECGSENPLCQAHCHSDDCEVHRDYAEDEEAIPLPVVGQHKSNEREEKHGT